MFGGEQGYQAQKCVGLLDGNAILFVNKIFFSNLRGRRGRREKREETVRLKRGTQVYV